MVTQIQKHLPKALLSAVVGLCLLVNTGQSAALTTSDSPLLNATLTSDNTTRQIQPLESYTSCPEDHKHFCANDGQCRYVQDSEKPSCICTLLYKGPRCMDLVFTSRSQTTPGSEQVIAITIGIIVSCLLLLAIGIYICVSKKCVKSTPLIKSAPSESSV